MTTICTTCNGSGESNHYGLLDCQAPGCTAADERAALEAAVDAAMPLTEYDQRWMAYQLGKTAALSQSPVAYAVTAARGGIHKLTITKDSAERKATRWAEEWPNNNCRVQPLIFCADTKNTEK